MTSYPKISIVIPTLNEEAHLPACLASIQRANYPQQQVEVVVCDTGSTDQTKEIAKQHGARVVSSSTQPPSAAAGLAAGIAAASGDYLQYVAADSLLHPQWLTTAIGEFSKTENHHVGVIGGATIEQHPLNSFFNYVLSLGLRAGAKKATAVLHNAGTGLIRQAVIAHGVNFDPKLPAEDEVDFGMLVRRSGFTFLKLPAPMILHDLGLRNDLTSLRLMLTRYWRQGIGRALLWRKHRGTPELGQYGHEVLPYRFFAYAPLAILATVIVAFLNLAAGGWMLAGIFGCGIVATIYASKHYALSAHEAFTLLTWYACTLWITELAFITHRYARAR